MKNTNHLSALIQMFHCRSNTITKIIFIAILSCIFYYSSNAQIPTNGLVGYWTFTGNADDVSGHNYDGVVNGATLTTDRFGNPNSAYEFFGREFIEVPFIDPFVAQSHTVSCWMRSNQSDSLGRLISLPTALLPGGEDQHFSLVINIPTNSGGVDSSFASLLFDDVCISGSGHAGIWAPSTHSVIDNNWHHVAGIIDSANHESRIYVDGQLENVVTYPCGPSSYATDDLQFGSYHGETGTSQNYVGTLDDPAIYNRVLDSLEIKNLFCSNGAFASIATLGSTTVCKPSSVVLNASPVGNGVLYQWKKGNNNISGATNSTYIATKTAIYKCIVTSICGSATSNSISVTINAQPMATITPLGNLDICQTGSVVLQANSGAGHTYQWMKGSNNISGATNQTYTATKAATYKVVVTNSNHCSKTSKGTKVTKSCREESITVVDDKLSIFPNPGNGKFSFEFSSDKIKDASATIELLSVAGQLVFEENEQIVDGTLQQEISLSSSLPNGIYLLQVKVNDEVYRKKVAVEK